MQTSARTGEVGLPYRPTLPLPVLTQTRRSTRPMESLHGLNAYDASLDSPRSEKCLHVGLIAGEDLPPREDQERDMSIHNVRCAARPEKFTHSLGRRLVQESDLHPGQGP
jgi:hypothetical protein